ncbi:MAG: hypothetical protein FWG68_08510 [Defluviitaleaceae bacterium]|nr:hypothetical protein [Defluviitaleaceae bacterium]
MLKEYAKLNKEVYRFLSTLTEQNLSDLANGKLVLTTTKVPKPAKVVVKGVFDDNSEEMYKLREICAHLKTLDDRKKAGEYLHIQRLKKAEFTAICHFSGIPIKADDSKTLLFEKVVDFFVGSKLRAQAIYKIDLK